jgi:serine/threonine-protein kinase RsbW
MAQEPLRAEVEIDPMAEQPVLLTIPARPEYIMLSRLALAALAGQGRLAEDTIADLKVAVSEACSHLLRQIDSGSRAAATANLRVEYLVSPERWVVQVSAPGAPLEAADEDDDPLSESNLGLTIIRALVDELELGVDQGGANLLRLIKRL